MLSTKPSYDNRIIASTLKMQIWNATNNRDVPRVMKTKFPATVMVFVATSHHATSHLRSRLESQHQSVPGCAEECGEPLVQSGGRWQTLGVAAGLGTGPQVQRDPGLASEGVLRLCTLLSLLCICWNRCFSLDLKLSELNLIRRKDLKVFFTVLTVVPHLSLGPVIRRLRSVILRELMLLSEI